MKYDATARAKKRAYYRANRARLKEKSAAWSANNPDKLQAKRERYNKKRRAKRFLESILDE